MAEITIIGDLLFTGCTPDELKPEFEKVIAASRKEEGNRGYELKQDLANPLHFFFVEKWASQEAIDQHNATAHFQNFFKAIENRLDKATVTLVRNYL